MLIPEFSGGLGNMMFQMASTYAIAKQTGHSFGITDIPLPPANHSSMDYKDTVFKSWYFYKTNLLPTIRIIEQDARPIDIDAIRSISNYHGVILSGNFQRHEYLTPYKKRVLQLFDLPVPSSQKYPDIQDAYFIHIRRGDYVENPFHELDLTNYYKKAIETIGEGVAYVVSNDMEWCKQSRLFDTIPHRFIEENDVDTLAIMTQCGKGGIAANSSFSWWGLYWNTNRPFLMLPEPWYPHNRISSDGYYFKEATIINIRT